jgi:uncharacterized repeat protein (TIGR03803 family)
MHRKKSVVLYAAAFTTILGCLAITAPLFAASKEKAVHNFDFVDGAGPIGNLIFDPSGNLYGTTYAGGRYGCQGICGVAFELIRKNGKWTEKVLHTFGKGKNDGVAPFDGLTFDNAGNLYGTTRFGGTSTFTCYQGYKGCGTVFELSPATNGEWTEKVLYNFCSANSCKDGAQPWGALTLDAAGNLYGTTFTGGINNNGTVFELSPGMKGKWREKILHSFNGKDGASPRTELTLDAAGNLYGTTSAGGLHDDGTVFELTSNKGRWTEKVVHDFNGKDGAMPWAGLILDKAGNFYGTTLTGGLYYDGAVFELTSNNGTWTEKVLHSFNVAGKGAGPNAGVDLDMAGNLYGTTEGGGTYEDGDVFELIPNNGKWKYREIHSFHSSDGYSPDGGVILDGAGNIFGTTNGGGVYGAGAVFKITP